MSTYIPVRKSQVYHYIKTPLFLRNQSGDYILYKAADTPVDARRFAADDSPELHIAAEMQASACGELLESLKARLIERIDSGDLKSVKKALCQIVEEALLAPDGDNLPALPETIDILYQEYVKISGLLKSLGDFQSGGQTLVEHSVNVMLLVMNYGMFNGLAEKKTKQLALGGLLHDIGLTRIPKKLTEANRRLTDQEFATYKTHPAIGHDIVIENEHIDASVARGVLEHHERLDGTGYPRGISNVTFEGRLFGIIDCFDNLTHTQRLHRKKEDPFGSMKRIQTEILEAGKFDKDLFIELCLSLLGKNKFS